MRIKTNKERQRRRAKKNASQDLRTQAPKLDALQMLRDVDQATKGIKNLMGESSMISEILEDYEKRLERIEDEIFPDTDQRRGDAEESAGTDDAECGGGVCVSPVPEASENLQETPACGDGPISD